MKITIDVLREFAGTKARPEILAAIAAAAPIVLPKYGITTPLRLQHFFPQIAHESGGFTITEENLRYSAKRLRQVWPKRFPTEATTAPYVNNPLALANHVYGGRMGNQRGTDDGYNFRGRGLIQNTGRDGYRQVGKIAGIPLEENPALANDPRYLLEVACAFWQWKGLNAYADRDDVAGATRVINGGLNGLADRKLWLAKARAIFDTPLDITPAPTDSGAVRSVVERSGAQSATDRTTTSEARTTMWPNQNPADMNRFYGNPDANSDGAADAAWERDNIVSITPPYTLYYPTSEQNRRAKAFKALRVHKKCAADLLSILTEIKAAFTPEEIRKYELDICGGTYVFRLKRGGTSLSMHSWASAIDLSHLINFYGKKYQPDSNMMPYRAIQIFEDHGWTWGGLWRTGDAMHFQAANVAGQKRYTAPGAPASEPSTVTEILAPKKEPLPPPTPVVKEQKPAEDAKAGGWLAAIAAVIGAAWAFFLEWLPWIVLGLVLLAAAYLTYYRIRHRRWPWTSLVASLGVQSPGPSPLPPPSSAPFSGLPSADQLAASLEALQAVQSPEPSASPPLPKPSATRSRATRRRPTSSRGSKRSTASASARKRPSRSSGSNRKPSSSASRPKPARRSKRT